jgi:hypothetical protein
MNLDTPLTDRDQLWNWCSQHLGLTLPTVPLCSGHQSPFDYLAHAYFEPSADVVVWGPRGGGKTRLAAAATVLDLLHKPGVNIRILGGSLEQSLLVWDHVLSDIERLASDRLAKSRSRSRKIHFEDGSVAAVLTQSQRNVRGQRVQKMRCDEVELFDPAVWSAVAATTRSRKDPEGRCIAGVVEAFSTFHLGQGLMEQILDRAKGPQGTRVIHWCILDVMATCEPERDCATCILLPECGGRAKRHVGGFVPVEDVIRIKRRMSAESWECEMLCLRPSREGKVFPRFSRDRHVREFEPMSIPGLELSLGVDFGFAAPFVALWVGRADDQTVYVAEEYVVKEKTVAEHSTALKASRFSASRIACDPAGNSRSEQTATSSIKLLRSLGWKVQSKASPILDGIELIRALIAPASDATRPRLVIHPRCRHLIAALEAYRYPVHRIDERPEKDGTHDHPIDALRYWLVNEHGGEMKDSTY